MNIYEKLVCLRDDALKMNVKKSGYNPHLKYPYYELSDIRPAANALEKKYKLADRYFIQDGMAYLELINVDNLEEKLMFSIPFGGSNLKGCFEIQNIGSSDTYCQRYLLRNFMGLVDGDVLELVAGTEVVQKPTEEQNIKNDLFIVFNEVRDLDEMVETYIDMTTGKNKEESEPIWEVAVQVMRDKKISPDDFRKVYAQKANK